MRRLFFMAIYKTEQEIVNLATGNGNTQRLSDVRVAQFGSARRSEIIAWLNAQTGGSELPWHDAWEEFLRGESIANSKYIEEERAVFHKTGSYS